MKTKIYFISVLLFSIYGFSQNLIFSDKGFKKMVLRSNINNKSAYPNYADTLEVSQEEADNVTLWELEPSVSDTIKSVKDLSLFKNLQIVHLNNYNDLFSYDIQNVPALNFLTINIDKTIAGSVYINDNPLLKGVWINGKKDENTFTNIFIKNNNIELTNITNINAMTMDFENNKNVGNLIIEKSEAKFLLIKYNDFQENDGPLLDSLTAVQTFDISHNTGITDFPMTVMLTNMNRNFLKNLQLVNNNLSNTFMWNVNIGNPMVFQTIFPVCEVLNVSGNKFSGNMDFMNFPKLTNLYVDDNRLTSINVKNGYDSFNWKNPPNSIFEFPDIEYINNPLVSICCDPNEVEHIRRYVDDFNIVNSNCTGMIMSTNEHNLKKLTITPNPVKDFINFSEILSNITIYDASGKSVKTFKTNTLKIDVHDLQKGFYFIKAQNNKSEIVNAKFAKQ